jgi:hypothetical protein
MNGIDSTPMKITTVLSFTALLLAARSFSQTASAPITHRDGRYTVKLQQQSLEVDPAIGGRITSLNINGKNFLTDSTVNKFNWGSSFWPSPQSDWDWPPPAEIDNQPYTAELKGDVLKLVSQKDAKFGLIVTKEFSGNKREGSFTIKYSITNGSDQVRKVAPWEVTRVHTQGIAFFPYGKGERRGGLIPSTIEKDGICWYVYDSTKVPRKGDTQLYADGAEGWFAQINGNVILVKKFPDIPLEKNAPKEGEVELYANKAPFAKSYVEIEHQGAYEELQPGETSTWEMTWLLRKLPASLKPKAGDPQLVRYARQFVK